MKIRKKEQSIGVLGKVLNALSKSNKDTYSANYLNDRLVKVSPTEPTDGEMVWIQKGKNLFNPDKHIISDGTFYSWENGGLSTHADYYGVKIPVSPNTVYVSSSDLEPGYWSSLCYWDKDMNWISGDAYNSNFKVITTPSNCAYITFALMKTYKWFQFEVGDTVTEYEAYDRRIHLKNDDGIYEEFINKKNMGKLIVDNVECKNLLNSLNDITNSLYRFTYTNVDGKLTFTCIETGTGGTFPLYYEIECEPNTDYCFSWNTLSFANGNKLFPYIYGNALDSSSEEHLLAYEDEAVAGRRKLVFNSGSYKKIVIGFYTTGSYTKGDKMVANDLQLEKGNIATEYVSYKEFENKIIYSTTEQRIGTWIDGKPLYRKVLYSTARVEAGSGYMNNTSIPNIDVVTDVDVTIGAYGYASFKNHWTNDGGDMKISTQFDKDSGLYISADYTGFIGWVLKVEYTKTTD